MKNLRRNAIHNVLGWLLPTAVFLALTPYMIRQLGREGFAVVSLIQVITGYMNVLNFGFSEAITKQVAESHERDPAQALRVLWVGFWLFFGFGLLGAVVVFAMAGWLTHDVLQISPALQGQAADALRIGAAVFLFQMVAEFYRGTAIGCMRFDVPNISRILRIGLSALLIVWAMQAGLGIVGVMWGTLGGLVVGLVVNAVWMQWVLPMRRPTGELRSVWHEIFHFSKHVFFTRLAGIVSGRLAQFLLGSLSSVANVALYEVPTRAAETGSVFLNRILQVFFPGFAAMDRQTEGDRIRQIFFSTMSIQLLITVPVFLSVILEGSTVLGLWIDPAFARDSASIILIVAVTYWLSSLTNLPVFLAMSQGLPQIVSKYSVIRMAITLVVGYPLVKQFGLVGAALTLFLSELQGMFLIRETIVRAFGAGQLGTLLRPLVLHVGIGAAIGLAYHFVWRASPYYSPWLVLLVLPAHLALAIPLRAVGDAEVARLRRLVLKW